MAIYVNTHTHARTPWEKFNISQIIRKSQVVPQEYFLSYGNWFLILKTHRFRMSTQVVTSCSSIINQEKSDIYIAYFGQLTHLYHSIWELIMESDIGSKTRWRTEEASRKQHLNTLPLKKTLEGIRKAHGYGRPLWDFITDLLSPLHPSRPQKNKKQKTLCML